MHRIAIGLVLAGASLAHTARAQEPGFSFSGYGTLGVARSSEDKADYLVDAFKPTGPGATREWSADVDSRLGAQVSANYGRVSAVLQVIAQQRYDDRYTPTVEWANIKYQATPELSLRAGRIVLPVFLTTDTRRVGYANPWIRPPVEVYSLVPVTSSDGADASWRAALGEANNTVHATFGRSNSKFPAQAGVASGTAKARDIFAVSDTVEWGPLTARLSYGRATLTIDAYDVLFDAYRQFGPPALPLVERFEVHDKKVDFVGFGASYDPGPWFAMAEWARFDTDSIVVSKSGWYASGGARIGKATPYATYGRIKPQSATSHPGLLLPPGALPPGPAAQLAFLNQTLNGALAGTASQKAFSVGIRWELLRNAALKLQYDRVKVDAGSNGTFGNLQPGFQTGGKANVFSGAVDFVF